MLSIEFNSILDTTTPLDNSNLNANLLNHNEEQYFPISAQFPSVFRKDKQSINFTWLNQGVDSVYTDIGMVLLFNSKEGDIGSKIFIPDVGNRLWIHELPTHSKYTFELPLNIANGTYELKFKLKNLGSDSQEDVFLPIDRSLIDSDHFIKLGEIQVIR